MMRQFDHERLTVYQAAIHFIVWAGPVIDALPKRMAVSDQLDRASTSIPLNIAEGNGKYTAPDRCRFFDNARGSALECAACLDVLAAKGLVGVEAISDGKTLLHEIVSMLFGLIRSNDKNRIAEESAAYQLNPQPL
jgi:four helix bundle protein